MLMRWSRTGPALPLAGCAPKTCEGNFGSKVLSYIGGETMTKDDARAEYLDVSANLRHWNTLRFAELTIYIALMGAMMNIAFGGSSGASSLFNVLLKIAGFLVSFLFWVLQERTMSWWYAFVERATELEDVLGYLQYHRRPSGHRLTGRIALRLFFFIVMAFWLAALFF